MTSIELSAKTHFDIQSKTALGGPLYFRNIKFGKLKFLMFCFSLNRLVA